MNITDKCCNQFGERDEIQTIINSLQADVVARGNRITELERALRNTNSQLHKAIEEVNHHLEHNICLKHYKRHANKEVCMCGLSVHKHGSFENHCIVSEWDYYVDGFRPSLRG